MNALPDNLFSAGALSKMQTLTLVKNVKFGGGVPSSLEKLAGLRDLYVFFIFYFFLNTSD